MQLTLFICVCCFSIHVQALNVGPLTYNEVKTSEEVTNLIEFVQEAIALAEKEISNIDDPRILALQGWSSSKVRHLLNNLCNQPETNYLEIGAWKGSTFISAMYNNKEMIENATVIDNWARFNDESVKDEFLANAKRFIDFPFSTHSIDSFSFDINLIKKPINVYFYDGEHSKEAQEQAFTYFNPVFDDVFIAVIDDWEFWVGDVRPGTFAAFKRLGYSILYERALQRRTNSWWNGVYVAVIQKKQHQTPSEFWPFESWER